MGEGRRRGGHLGGSIGGWTEAESSGLVGGKSGLTLKSRSYAELSAMLIWGRGKSGEVQESGGGRGVSWREGRR